MTNSVIQWNCRGLRPNFDELSILDVKHNSLAVCLQDTFLKDTENITVRGFNLYHKFHETENRASGGVSILVNKNIPQSIVTLNTNLQTVTVKVIGNIVEGRAKRQSKSATEPSRGSNVNQPRVS